MSNFVEGRSEETLEIVEAGAIWNKDLFPRIKIDVGVPTVQLGQAKKNAEGEGEDDEEEEEEEVPVIPIVKPCTGRPPAGQEGEGYRCIHVEEEINT